MAVHLIVDGYNLMGVAWGGRLEPGADLELSRKRLLEQLRGFRAGRPLRVTVVFDGPGPGTAQESWWGLKVVFAGGQGRADGAIVRMVRCNPQGVVVATSDRALAESCRRMGAAVLSSQELMARLLAGNGAAQEGSWPEKEEQEAPGHTRAGKRGPSQRLSRKDRREMRRLRKL